MRNITNVSHTFLRGVYVAKAHNMRRPAKDNQQSIKQFVYVTSIHPSLFAQKILDQA